MASNQFNWMSLPLLTWRSFISITASTNWTIFQIFRQSHIPFCTSFAMRLLDSLSSKPLTCLALFYKLIRLSPVSVDLPDCSEIFICNVLINIVTPMVRVKLLPVSARTLTRAHAIEGQAYVTSHSYSLVEPIYARFMSLLMLALCWPTASKPVNSLTQGL